MAFCYHSVFQFSSQKARIFSTLFMYSTTVWPVDGNTTLFYLTSSDDQSLTDYNTTQQYELFVLHCLCRRLSFLYESFMQDLYVFGLFGKLKMGNGDGITKWYDTVT